MKKIILLVMTISLITVFTSCISWKYIQKSSNELDVNVHSYVESNNNDITESATDEHVDYLEKIESFYGIINYSKFIEAEYVDKYYDFDAKRTVLKANVNGNECQFFIYDRDDEYQYNYYPCGRIDLTSYYSVRFTPSEKIKIYYEGEYIGDTEKMVIKAITNNDTDIQLKEWIENVKKVFSNYTEPKIILPDDALTAVCEETGIENYQKYIIKSNDTNNFFYSDDRIVTINSLCCDYFTDAKDDLIYYRIDLWSYVDLNDSLTWERIGQYWVFINSGEVKKI